MRSTFVLSKRGNAQVDERTNSLLVSDIESRLDEVESLVTSLDTETRQVEITARLVDVDQTTARQLGIDWKLENLHSNSETGLRVGRRERAPSDRRAGRSSLVSSAASATWTRPSKPWNGSNRRTSSPIRRSPR